MKKEKHQNGNVMVMELEYPIEWEEYIMAAECPTVAQLQAAGFSLDEATEIILLWRIEHQKAE